MTEPKPAGTPSGPCRLVLAWIIAVVVIWSVAAIYGQVGKPDQNAELPQSSVDVLRAGTDRIIDVSPSTVIRRRERNGVGFIISGFFRLFLTC
jgi:hypothetical protein